MKSSVLGVGTELTSGQILNRNGWWISQKLKALGLTTSLHLVVPDDRALILESLRFSFDRSDFIFVTGGLGPTSDDFTRDLICEFTGRTTYFDETSWQKVESRLNSRGIQIREFQKQQCYFPVGAHILKNSNGTADGFQLEFGGKHLFVLPGPPNEIEGIWKDHLENRVRSLTLDVDKSITHSWDILGLSESEVAALMEPLIAGADLEVAYRVHLPFVEFKLTHVQSQSSKAEPTLQKVNLALQDFQVVRDGNDWSAQLCQIMEKTGVSQAKQFFIIDEVGGGYLLNRLLPNVKTLLRENRIQFLSTGIEFKFDVRDCVLKVSAAGERRAQFEVTQGSKSLRTLTDPQTSRFLTEERERMYFVETGLRFWSETLPIVLGPGTPRV